MSASQRYRLKCRITASKEKIELNRKIALALIVLLFCAGPTFAQKRSRTTQQKRPTSRQRSVTPPPPSFREDAAAVAEQLKIVSRFLYLYGRVSNGLESADVQEKRGELSRALIEQNRQGKAKVIENMRILTAGLDQLLTRFQNNSRLEPYASHIQSAVTDAATAQQLATAGRLDEAGRKLVSVAERLTEVLVELR